MKQYAVKSLSILVLLVLAACGFTPMYGTNAGNGAAADLQKVDIALIPDQSGVYLRNALIDRFYQNGYPAAPAYRLVVTKITETKNDLDITVDSEATRKQLRLSLDMSFVDTADGKTVLMRTLKSVTSYNVLGSQFATRISEADAREAALNDLARQIESELMLYLKRTP